MPDAAKTGQAGERLAKVIARSGLCSRRDAEDWIKAGRVAVNGSVVRTPAFNVADKDRITVDGNPLAARRGTRVWLYHKPAGLVVTEKDPQGRPTIFSALAEEGLPRVLTVGRLDINTEGLLLLTNDGGLKRVLELPATGWLRRYRVRAHGTVTQAELDTLKGGIEVEGIKYGPIDATLERQQGSNAWLLLALREGKNREVKNVLATFGLEVNRLIRVSYGPFQLGDLPIGGVEVVKSRVLREQLGKKLAAEAGVDFDSELPEPAALVKRHAQAEPSRERPRAGAGRDHGGRDRAGTAARQGGAPSGRSFSGPGDRGRPLRPERDAEPRQEGPPRRILFDDGRPPEEYRLPARRERERDRDGPPRGGASARGRPASGAGSPRAEGRGPRSGSKPGARPDAGPGGRSGPRPPRPAGPRGPRSAEDRGVRPGGARSPRPAKREQRPGAGAGRPSGGPAGKPPGPRSDGSARSTGGKPDRGPGGRPVRPAVPGGRPKRPSGPAARPPRKPRGR